MTAHSFAEGVGVGAAFGSGESLGLVTAIAIAIHNIPEGLAISLVLVPQGVSVLRAAGSSVFSSVPQPLVASPPSSSSPSSTVWYLLGSASPAARCSGWSSPRWSPTRSRRARGGPRRSHLSGSTAAMLTLEALLLT
jgi:hypothetical protein